MIGNLGTTPGWIIVTEASGTGLMYHYDNNILVNAYNVCSQMRLNVFRDNEGEIVKYLRFFKNTSEAYDVAVIGDQTELAANLAKAGTTEITEALWVKADDTNLEFNGSGRLHIKDSGVKVNKVNSDLIGNGLQLSGGQIVARPDGVTVELNGSELRIKPGGVTGDYLADATVLSRHIAAAVAGSGLGGGAGAALSVNVDGTSLSIGGDTLSINAGGVTAAMLQDAIIGASKLLDNAKYFTVPFELVSDAANIGADNTINMTKNFRIWAITGSVIRPIVHSAGGQLQIEFIANGTSEYTHSLNDGTPADTPFIFGAFTTIPLDLTLSDFSTTWNSLQFRLKESAASIVTGSVRIEVHCLLL